MSWVESANTSGVDFPIQNLPLGVFTPPGADDDPRIGCAIGDQILDVRAAVDQKLLGGLSGEVACAASAATLNGLMGQGRAASTSLRESLSTLLSAGSPHADSAPLYAQSDCTMHLPATIGDYTDFYASIHHATNIGSMFRPDNPLMPNYRHLPVGYHGRASTVVLSGTPIRRPMGQLKPDDNAPPMFGPCRLLDYELEMGFFVGEGNAIGERITMADSGDNIFGMCIVNDWSARDIQKWEYQPLGPFNAKNFATSISPWVVTTEALEPFRVDAKRNPDGGGDDPPMLDYLRPPKGPLRGLDIRCEVHIASEQMRQAGTAPKHISTGTFADMYWTIEQMLVHHSSTGCAMRPGDLLASGTISGPNENNRGCLLEYTWRGQNPIDLPDGTQRKFLQDGDEVIITAYCEGDGAKRIGFGSCRGIIMAAAG